MPKLSKKDKNGIQTMIDVTPRLPHILCETCYHSEWCVASHYVERGIYKYAKSYQLAIYCHKKNQNIKKVLKRCVSFQPETIKPFLPCTKPYTTYNQALEVLRKMVDTSGIEQFTTAEDFQENELLTIDKEEFHKVADFGREGEEKRKSLVVKFVEKAQPTVINKTSVRKITTAFGKNTAKWVNKKVFVELKEKRMVAGAVKSIVYFAPKQK